MNFSALEKKLQAELEKTKAAQAADLCLSPYIQARLLLTMCHEAGPTNWVINRSDIYDQTLEVLLKHPLDSISIRANEKIKIRKSLPLISPPEITTNFEDIKDYEVEDYLGHPLCPFEAILYFSKSINDDHRASAALSLTRRTLEHAPDWSINPSAKHEIAACFAELLLSDPSPMVRSYTARVPLLDKQTINKAAKKEEHSYVLARLLQHPETDVEILSEVASETISQNEYVSNALALDKRLPKGVRSNLMQRPTSALNELIHEWYVECNQS